MSVIAFHFTGGWTVFHHSNQAEEHQTCALLSVCVRRSPVDSPHKGTVIRKMVPFRDAIVFCRVTVPGRFVNGQESFTAHTKTSQNQSEQANKTESYSKRYYQWLSRHELDIRTTTFGVNN